MSPTSQAEPAEDGAANMPPFGASRRICFWVTAFIVAVSFLIAVFCHQVYKRECLDNYGVAASSVARTVASVIDGDQFQRDLREKKAEPYRERIRGFLNKIQNATRVNHVYVVGRETEAGIPEFAASGQNDPIGLAHPADSYPPELRATLQTGAAARTQIYSGDPIKHSAFGSILSSYCPILDSTGAVVGAVGSDIGVDRALQEAQEFAAMLAAGFLALAALAGTLLYFYSRNIFDRPLNRISRAVHKLSMGDVDIPPLPVTQDAFGPLSRDVNRVVSAVSSITLGMNSVLNQPVAQTGISIRGQSSHPLSGKFQQLADGISKALTVMDNVDAMVYVAEPDTYKLIYHNRKMERAHRVSETSPSERLCWRWFGDGSGPCPECRLPELLAMTDALPAIEWENYNTHLDAWFRIRNSIVKWIDGRTVLFCEAHDISQNKAVEEIQLRQEEELAEAAKAAREASLMKTTFLANMSHEIRTPMNGIIGFAELAMDDPGISPKGRTHIEKIKYSAEGLLQIINDILDISKIETGRVDVDHVPFTVRDVFDRCETICQPKAREKGLQLYCFAEPFVKKTLLGDPVKLRQVLLNLLSNAIKFTQKGVVKLACTVEHATPADISLRFEVADSGIGMSAEQIDKVFDAFTQGDSSATRKYGGTGLGLAITKNFIEVMGGSLNVVSTPGIGSKFSFTLTFETQEEASVPEKPEETESRDARRPRFSGDVLVCEDNDINQEVIREHLERLGLNVVMAADGKAGVEAVRTRMDRGEPPFDLILMDIHMPIMGGTEAATLIRKSGCGTPIVALTANVMLSDLDSYLEQGMSDALGKPFRAAELWATLRKHLPEDGAASLPDAAAADTPSAPVPSGPAVDLDAGLANAAGNRNLLERLLRNFASDNRNTINNVKEALAAGERKVAHRLVHSLKSTSRTIGAARLGDIAQEVESDLLDDSQNPTAAPAGLDRLDGALVQVLGALDAHLAPPVPSGDADSAPTPKGLGQLLDELEPMLRSSDSECLQFVDRIKNECGDQGRELAALMESYDFDAAIRTLTTIREQLESSAHRGDRK